MSSSPVSGVAITQVEGTPAEGGLVQELPSLSTVARGAGCCGLRVHSACRAACPVSNA